MDSYAFYFDESFHDRKIRIKSDGTMNTLREDTLDNYIGVFWGRPQKEMRTNRELLSRFENKYRAFYDLQENQELKSTLISKKNFVYGIKSFNNETLSFYEDLFKMLDYLNPVIQVNMISKMELFLRSVFGYVGFSDIEDVVVKDAFFYSLTKFMLTYHTPKLLKAFPATNDEGSIHSFVEEVIRSIDLLIEAEQGIIRKERECASFRQLRYILSHAEFRKNPPNEIDFVYETVFSGLSRLLSEKEIQSECTFIYIDEEAKTYDAAKQFKFALVTPVKSDKTIEIRLSDWIASFIGRIVFAIMHDKGMHEDTIESFDSLESVDLASKRVLSPDWFDISERQYDLYKLIYSVLVVDQGSYWAAMTLSYGDQCAIFYSLLRYFAKYKSYEEYKVVEKSMHSEYFNSSCLVELERSYKEFR